MKGSVARGANYLTRGARLLNHPALRPFVLIPLMINILIFGALISIGFSYMSDLMDWMLSRIPDWLHFIKWILWPLIGITVSLITGYLSPRPLMHYWLRKLRS
jgi:CysZ protein